MIANPSSHFRRARWCVAGGALLAGAAMLRYPGGTLADHSSAGYSLSMNYLSDLGMTVAYNGQSNRLGATLFSVSLFILVAGFGSLVLQLSRLYPEPSKRWARAGGIAAVLACVAFAGVAITPENHMMRIHVAITAWAWRFAAFCPVLLAIASAKTDQFSRHVTIEWVALTGLLFGYAALLTLSHTVFAFNDPVFEVVAQKVVTATTGALLVVVSLHIEQRALMDRTPTATQSPHRG